MPLDGVVVRNIVNELIALLSGGKIDKISQPEPDEVILTIRNNGQNFKLLLSASPSYPRVHITNTLKQNPIEAPMFCMVMRKHLSGGKIIGFEQYNLDRIIKIYIENYDELGNLSTKIIICEIMGRRSNITLVNQSNFMIIDSIKHLTAEMNSFRQVLPGITYKYPPIQDKLEPLDFNDDEFRRRLISSAEDAKLGKFISGSINGFSSLAAEEICHNAGLDPEIMVHSLSSSAELDLKRSLTRFIECVKTNDFKPSIYMNKSSIYDFYSFKLNCLNSFEIDSIPDISSTIEHFYEVKDKIDRARQKSSDLYKIVNTNLSRCYKKLSIQEEKLMECGNKDKWRSFGDLIMANLYNIKKGDSKALVPDLYDENQPTVEIILDMLLTPVENAQRYYRKYNKEKTAELITVKQREENHEEIDYLEGLQINLENCTENDEIDEIRNELISACYIKKNKKGASRKKSQSSPLHFLSSDGIDIYVGKNNVQNDYLTTRFAEPSDIWLHTKNIPGSHVIIKLNNEQASDNTIFEAASLAAFYSKSRNSSNIPVDYTERKNVKKPSGSKPGMVIYYTNRTIYVTPDKDYISSIKNIK